MARLRVGEGIVVREARTRSRGPKLTEKDVRAIRLAWAGRVTRRDLAERFGISETWVSAIVAKRSWVSATR